MEITSSRAQRVSVSPAAWCTISVSIRRHTTHGKGVFLARMYL
jgi:hypothetical protein